MAQGRDQAHPPADPHPSTMRGRAPLPLPPSERPVRVQLGAALALGVALVASGLYLWRRPHESIDGANSESAPAESPGFDAGPPAAAPVAAAAPLSLSDVRVVGCHDRGPRVTPADECDHLAAVEQALSKAIEQSVACFPTTADGATIEYLADVSFLRHKLRVTMPRAGRSEHDRKVVSGCGTAVREAIRALPLDGISHQHARYQIAVTASYRGRG